MRRAQPWTRERHHIYEMELATPTQKQMAYHWHAQKTCRRSTGRNGSRVLLLGAIAARPHEPKLEIDPSATGLHLLRPLQRLPHSDVLHSDVFHSDVYQVVSHLRNGLDPSYRNGRDLGVQVAYSISQGLQFHHTVRGEGTLGRLALAWLAVPEPRDLGLSSCL